MRSYEVFGILELLNQKSYTSSLKLAEQLGIGEKTLRERIRDIKKYFQNLLPLGCNQ